LKTYFTFTVSFSYVNWYLPYLIFKKAKSRLPNPEFDVYSTYLYKGGKMPSG